VVLRQSGDRDRLSASRFSRSIESRDHGRFRSSAPDCPGGGANYPVHSGWCHLTRRSNLLGNPQGWAKLSAMLLNTAFSCEAC
jgi:hypothetical protein